MAQFTSTVTTPDGLVVNTILDTITNLLTYTVTAPNGTVATNTQNADVSGSNTNNMTALRNQLAAGGVILSSQIPLVAAVRDSTTDVKEQSLAAPAEVQETKAIPVSADSVPAVSSTEEVVEDKKVVNEPLTIPEDSESDQVLPEDQKEVDAFESNFSPSEVITPNPQQDAFESDFTGTSVLNPQSDAFESDFTPTNALQGLSAAQTGTRATGTAQDVANFKQKEDWRVRLSLAPGADYLYKSTAVADQGILAPLNATDGVIFPYTPQISVQYAAHYDPTEITHSNYKYFQYKSSSVDSVTITCDFTAQDTAEAKYLLAVIHFFRSVTKMFYGLDNGPKPGTPPPLCYLSGLGTFQFDAHPLAITAFNYSLPNDVDYIRAGEVSAGAGVNQSPSTAKVNNNSPSQTRMQAGGLNLGGTKNSPKWNSSATVQSPTYVPTKMQIQITAVPIVTRNDISTKFSLAEYGTGRLLRGTDRTGGGIW